MNSAEKKAPEPSMDDIISSIRNIIADDTNKTVPEPIAPAAENPSPAIVQLTENQIADPAHEQANGASVSPETLAPGSAASAEAAGFQSTPDLEAAREIDAVPGLMATPEVANAASAPGAPPAAISPELKISDPLAPATSLETTQVNGMMAAPAPGADMTSAPSVNAAPTPDQSVAAQAFDEPGLSATAAQGSAANPLSDQSAAMPEDDIAFVSPEVPQAAAVDDGLTPTPAPLAQRNDPIEEMMQTVNSDLAEGDTINNGVDPDQILEGMEAGVEPEPVSEPAPLADGAPVILDASQVTPEDAVAITAVAVATTKAMTDTSASAPTPPASQEPAGTSIEDIVRTLLKPMIREWLDDNMPRILEGVIKEEITAPGSDKT